VLIREPAVPWAKRCDNTKLKKLLENRKGGRVEQIVDATANCAGLGKEEWAKTQYPSLRGERDLDGVGMQVRPGKQRR